MVYLQAKASNNQLPFVDPVVEFDVFTTHPTQLHMQQRLNATNTHLYFYVTKSGRNRSAGNGFWHASTSATAILNRKREVIGYRSMLVYYNNALNTNTKKRDRSEKNKWILHEYTLPEAHNMNPFGLFAKLVRQEEHLEVTITKVVVFPHNNKCNPKRTIEHGINGTSLSAEVDQQRPKNAIQSNVMMVEACADDDQEWIENLESILEVDDEAQQPLQQICQYNNNLSKEPVLQQMLPDDAVDEDDACIEDMENWIGNFDYCMDMIKELHDEVYDINGNSELEIDEQPFAKRVKY
ncbi:hypothetical protein Sjap_025972 [Stephania japonica]|uniref:NAC domain-containing protein n=1 Tax=Stephania japonica TaxID=461633 RepID=A0AAP0HIG3_9MAGN